MTLVHRPASAKGKTKRRPNVETMVDEPKRSVGETISQLVVIAILIAILIGALIFLRQYIESHNTSSLPAASLQLRAVAHSNSFRLVV